MQPLNVFLACRVYVFSSSIILVYLILLFRFPCFVFCKRFCDRTLYIAKVVSIVLMEERAQILSHYIPLMMCFFSFLAMVYDISRQIYRLHHAIHQTCFTSSQVKTPYACVLMFSRFFNVLFHLTSWTPWWCSN